MNIDNPTKRQVASKFAETFDPLGLIAAITVPLKRLIKKVWESEKGWNDKLPPEIKKDWRLIQKAITDPEISCKRPLRDDYNHTDLHILVFSDASQDIYGALAYACFFYPDKKPVISLITSKNKIKPSRNSNWSIPKIELIGIEIGSNLVRSIVNELRGINVTTVRSFTDSMIALYWLLSPRTLDSGYPTVAAAFATTLIFLRNVESKLHSTTVGLKITQQTFVPHEASEPILVHPKHKIAELLAIETHVANGHQPPDYTRFILRTKYYIPGDSTIINNVIRKCTKCKRVNGRPYEYPFSKTLPLVRTTPAKPFQHDGLDYMGPIPYLKDDGVTYGKAYVLIYTCLVTRGTILKVIPDAATATYCKALKIIFTKLEYQSQSSETTQKLSTSVARSKSRYRRIRTELFIDRFSSRGADHLPNHHSASSLAGRHLRTCRRASKRATS
ncbi:hypothetical protein B9Z55_027140 [Caenorhabditis nigoni]|uniref:Integrase zinc-binding domain-containing protein n=1 Tax=Caenorhabditis nigoni TaxID=1611254 RepID=A0A2G5SGE0_9PELO|nr:hypothetical protein B9Z55_027140 [Caenorhabditis nigoni]